MKKTASEKQRWHLAEWLGIPPGKMPGTEEAYFKWMGFQGPIPPDEKKTPGKKALETAGPQPEALYAWRNL
jgi:hypothetical protein